MNRKSIIVFCIITGLAFAQSIEETLQQIEALKKEIAQNEKLVEEKIADLKRTNPLFAEQDIFESDAEYLGRMSRAMPQLDRLRKQYLYDLWQKMSILRGRLFETTNIEVSADPKGYDANSEIWTMNLQHFDFHFYRLRPQASHRTGNLVGGGKIKSRNSIFSTEFGS